MQSQCAGDGGAGQGCELLGSQGKGKSTDERGLCALGTALHRVRYRTESSGRKFLYLSGTSGKRSIKLISLCYKK